MAAYVTLPDSAGGSFDELLGRSAQDTGFTGWFWTAAVASVVAVVPAALAVRLVPTWPEMGSRYDAPAAAASAAPGDRSRPTATCGTPSTRAVTRPIAPAPEPVRAACPGPTGRGHL